jgi:glycosyltransferase involved in cell wall biosynthesis
VRVLQVITPSKIAGAERSTTSLCEHLVKAGHGVVVACKLGHPLIEVMQKVGLDVRGVPISGKGNLAAPFHLARLARKERVDLINTQLSTAALWGSVAGKLAGVPVVATVRALNTKTCYVLADRVIAIAQAVKQHLVSQGMRAGRIDVVYNGIDPERYRPTVTRVEARERLGLDEDALVFALVAHLTAKKGHALFLDAAARIATRSAGHHYLFVGDGPERVHLERQAQRLALADRVTFTGFTPDVLPFYAASDVVVLPSIAMEGLGRVLMEGGLLGLPVIGSDMGGIAEVIQHQETGLVVPPGDVRALADAMLRLGGDPDLRARMGAAGRERVRRLFTIPAMVEGTLATYRQALRDRGKALDEAA